VKVSKTEKPENVAGGRRAPGGSRGPEAPRKLLDLSCFGGPKMHFQAAQVLVVKIQITVSKSWIGCQKQQDVS